MFYCKEQRRNRFPGEKKAAARSRLRKTDFMNESKTIAEGLGKYAIGAKLRRLRLRKSMGLLELSRHTGLSPALLSKLERDVMHPTLPTLLRIAMVFSVDLGYFFVPEPKPVLEIVRKSERIQFPDSPENKITCFHFESLDFPVPERALNSYLAEFEPMEIKDSRCHQHPGIELLYLISGKLELRIGDAKHELSEGDAIYFDSTVPHSYRRIAAKRTAALVVTTNVAKAIRP